MKNRNMMVALSLITIQFLFTIFLLALTFSWLSSEIQLTASYVPKAIPFLLDFFDEKYQRIAYEVLVQSMTSLDNSWIFWLWVSLSFTFATVLMLLIQVSWIGPQSKWKYISAAIAFICIWLAISYIFGLSGLVLSGKIFGFFTADFTGLLIIVRNKYVKQLNNDIRELNASQKKPISYDPLKYFDLKKGIFVGLSIHGKPVYIPINAFRKHLQIIGETRMGKTVSAILFQAQAAFLNECVIVFDPKNDKFAPIVLKATANRAGVPFIYINLNADQPAQLNPFSGATESEIEELLINCFELSSKGDNAEIYRVLDRAALRKLTHSGAKTILEMLKVGAMDESINSAKMLWEGLQELGAHPVIHTSNGLELDKLIREPSVIYITGSKGHDNTIRLQKLVLLRILQIIDKSGLANNANWISLYLDEFKYLLCPAALRALGTVADRNCHLTIVHQSLGDLSDVDNLDPNAIRGAVIVNTGLKLVYKTLDPESAAWASKMSGTVNSFTETISKSAFSASPGSYLESQKPLFDINIFLSLPKMTGVLFGAGLAQQVRVNYLPCSDESPEPYIATPENPASFIEEII
ncbi:MAG: hypothetical protein V4545_04230 [Pseudomonadota bacterium]